MTGRLRVVGVIMVVAAVAACGGPHPTPGETTLTTVGEQAPDFTVTTLDGRPFTLSEQRGSVVVLDFFATWCPPCREEMPALEKDVWQRFRGEDFAMLALGREQSATDLEPFVQEFGLTFPIAADSGRDAFALYAESYIPRTVVVGPEGRILFQSTGYEREEFERMVAVIDEAVTAARSAATSSPATTS